METYLVIAAAAFGCGLVILLLRSPSALKRFALGAAGGLAALGAVDVLAAATGVALAPNIFTVCAAAVFGLPGVVAMLFAKLILAV
jgi:hypothetical protein